MTTDAESLHVLLATDAFPPNCGGSGWSTWELARGLRRRGHAVTIVQPRPRQPAGERVREYDGFRVHELGAPAPDVPFLRNYFKNERLTRVLVPYLSHLVEQRGIQVVHGQHVLTGPAAVLAARRTHRVAICTVRDYWPVCYWSDLIVNADNPSLCPACTVGSMARCIRARAGRAWPFALPMVPYMRRNLARKRAALARADAVIAVSSTIGRDLRARVPELARTRLDVIPNPVDIDSILAHAHGDAPIDGPYAIYAGKLAPNKGSRWLVDVARESNLPWPLIIVGDGPERAALERAAQAAHVDARFPGWRPRDEALRWLAHASVVVFPSHGPESLSRVLLESSALGRAIAAMDTGGTRDILEHGRTALLSTTPHDLARHVAALVSDPELRATLGAAARAHVRTHFDASAVVGRVEVLYRELLAQQPRGGRLGEAPRPSGGPGRGPTMP